MKNYEWYVKEGRSIVVKLQDLRKQTESYQVKIAKWALEVCTIKHGGRSEGFYTLKQYAFDIGLAPKTVNNWVNAYRHVLLKVKDDQTTITTKEWAAAQKTHDLLKKERVNTNKEAGKTGTRFAYKMGVPDEKVKKIYNEVINNEKSIEHEFLMLEASVKNAKHILSTRNLLEISDSRLLAIMENLDEASEVINRHLTAKQDSGGKQLVEVQTA